MANLGFVGLGVMGSEMVVRLLDKGHTVTGYNRTKSKAQRLIDRGMKWADSPRAVCAAADVTFSMVTNSAALHTCVRWTGWNAGGTERRQGSGGHEHRKSCGQPRRWRPTSAKRAQIWWMRLFREAR